MSIDFETEIDGPSLSELAAIEAEWPRIEADLAELDAEIEALYAADRRPDDLDWRRKRRSEAQLTRTASSIAGRPRRGHDCATWSIEVALTQDCPYGCKIVRCGKCGGERVQHYAIYGCRAGVALAGHRVAA
ncbi:DUF6284 family protein [Actinoplanes sp. HUAS TT8]|uniref:DUF6284 family protein n=1 Tax=Actinoplanes sp. HUAS TT8 TaxID=3447453 RepID=UPI003F5204F9